MSEAATFVFEPLDVQPTVSFMQNRGTSAYSIIINCSGSDGPQNPCWKAVDGVFKFDYGQPGEGWNGNGGSAVFLCNTNLDEYSCMLSSLDIYWDARV